MLSPPISKGLCPPAQQGCHSALSENSSPLILNPAVQTAKYAEYAEGHELTIGSMFTPPIRWRGGVSRSYARCPAFFRIFRVFRGSNCLFQAHQAQFGTQWNASLPATTDNAAFLIRVLGAIRGYPLRARSVHRQFIGDVQGTSAGEVGGEADGVLACRQRRQQQIHAIFGGRSHRGAIGDAG